MTIYLSIDSFLFIIIVSFSLLGSFIVSINRRCDLKIQIGYFFVGFIGRFLPPGAAVLSSMGMVDTTSKCGAHVPGPTDERLCPPYPDFSVPLSWAVSFLFSSIRSRYLLTVSGHSRADGVRVRAPGHRQVTNACSHLFLFLSFFFFNNKKKDIERKKENKWARAATNRRMSREKEKKRCRRRQPMGWVGQSPRLQIDISLSTPSPRLHHIALRNSHLTSR